ncbi:hypothetical protein JYP51_22290 [Ponticoccus gilvus]|nr:hypothetical protein [Enemella evansiae]
MTLEGSQIEIDAVDFQISCRRFTVRATITRDRQLPVVDEFVLRLLAIVDRMPSRRMRAWFGFSQKEMEAVLIDLGRRNFIEFEGDDVFLGPAGHDLFISSGMDGNPRIVEVAPLIGDVWFDLISRNMVPSTRSKSAEFYVKLTEIPAARNMPEVFARAAFEENFRDYVKMIRRLPDPDAVNLYSISGVEGSNYGHQVLKAGIVLDTDQMIVRPTFPELGDHGLAYQRLTLAANDAWKMISPPDKSSSADVEFQRMTGDNNLASLIASPSSTDAWVSAFGRSKHPNSSFQPTLGASYLKGNINRFLEALSVEDSSDLGKIIWLRPSGSTWGRTALVAEAVNQIRQLLKNNGSNNLESILFMPRSTRHSDRTIHKAIFDKGFLLPQGHLPANMEVLLVPGKAALVNVHILAGQHSVALGGVTTDPARLSRIVAKLTRGKSDGWGEIWVPRRSGTGAVE